MLELVEVFLYNLGGGFTEIRKVRYRFLQRQPNGRFVHLLPFWPAYCSDTVRIAEPSVPEKEMAMDNSESDSNYAMSTGSSFDFQEGGECGADPPATRCPRYILPAPPPIPRLEDVPCLF
ncbi:hypothetical protein PIB30_078220 [Stylosanthes scabra]|uniref:Uncharacterized protein n=1 Tax=Stylosanthes scabra TaxID=79078 RepID=A0ABU6UPK2_9FABA|nr:hypothetical protein [Stylosanthes scabra]